MSKDQRFKSHIEDLFDGEPAPSPTAVDMQDGPVLTYRRMTPPPGSHAFSSVKQAGQSKGEICQRCRERDAVGGIYCPECQKIQDSLFKIASEIDTTGGGAAEELRQQRSEGMTPSPSELNRPSIMQTGSLFDELLEEVKQIQEPAPRQTPPLFDESDMEFITDDPGDDAFDSAFDDFDDFEVEVSGGVDEEPVARQAPSPEPLPTKPLKAVEGAAGTLRHSPDMPLARDLPIHRPSPSQYIRTGKQEVAEMFDDAPDKKPGRPQKAVVAGKPLSDDQVHDVDALLLDLIHVEEQPPPPRSPLRIIFIRTFLFVILCAAGAAAYFFLM